MKPLFEYKECISRENFISELQKINDERKTLFLEFETALINTENIQLTYTHQINDCFCIFGVYISETETKILRDFKKTADKHQRNVNLSINLNCIALTLTENRIYIKAGTSSPMNYRVKYGNYDIPYPKERYRKLSIKSVDDIMYVFGKPIKLSLKTFSSFEKDSLMWLCIDVLLKKWQEKNLFWRDIAENTEELKIGNYPPTAVKDVFDFHNTKQFLEKKFKITVPKAVNKTRFDIAYYVTKTAKTFPENDRQIIYTLLNVTDFNFKNLDFSMSEKNRTNAVIFAYYKRLSGYNPDKDTYIRDYINMAKLLKEPLSLKIKTIDGLIRKHDKLAEKGYLKRMPEVKIPQNSKFNAVNLPPEYERITTRKRLAEESTVNKHCVWSYADSINNDKCAVYSVVYGEKRYTVEVRKKGSKFSAVQVRGFANAECPSELRENINKLLKTQKPLLS